MPLCRAMWKHLVEMVSGLQSYVLNLNRQWVGERRAVQSGDVKSRSVAEVGLEARSPSPSSCPSL